MLSQLQEIELIKTGILPDLISDYILQKDFLAHLYQYPFHLSSFKTVIADKAKDNTDRKTLVNVLRTQYAGIPTSDVVSSNIESLLSENTFTVTAAHQPCLFLGPLYNVFKISSVINFANQLKQVYPDKKFVPVFWLGTEDHDVEELSHVYVNGKKIDWTHTGTGASGKWNTTSMKSVISDLRLVIGENGLVDILETGLEKYSTFGGFTQYFVNEIFKEHGLVVLDGDDVRLKEKFSAVIKDEVLNSRAVEVLKSNIDFFETNYKAQAKPRDINFFYLGDNYRERIVFNAATGKYEVNNTAVAFTKDEIAAEIDNHPERFSPNVIYRPLYQETVLPNLAFVGGTGELSYWLELKPLFDYYKINYPVQVMRNSAAIVSSPVQKKLEKLNLSPADFFTDVEQLINRYVGQSMNGELHLADEKKKIEGIFESVLSKVESADVTLKQAASAEKQKAITSLENLEAKMLKAEKRKQETSVNQIRSVHAALFPDGELQERREGFLSFYDKDFINTLVNNLNVFDQSFKFFLNQ